MNKIKSTSHLFYLFFKTLCWALPLVNIGFILFNLEGMLDWGAWSNILSAKDIQNITHLSLTHRFIILVIDLLPLSITIMICHKLAKLFLLYEQGHLFEKENIQLIKYIGLYMIGGELIQLIYQPLISTALSFNNAVGERFASITLGTTNVSTLITGFIILVASWIIQEAHQLKSDAQLTI